MESTARSKQGRNAGMLEEAAKHILAGHLSRNTNANDRNVAEIICFVCRKLREQNRTKAVWILHLIGKVPHVHRSAFIAALSEKFKISRKEMIVFVVSFKDEYFSSKQNSKISNVKRHFTWPDVRCTIPFCNSINCRPVGVSVDEYDIEHIRISDAIQG